MPADKYDEMARELFREWNALPAQQRIVPAVLASRIAALVRREVEARHDEIATLIKRIGEINASDHSLNGEHRRRLLAEIEVNLAAIRARGGANEAKEDASAPSVCSGCRRLTVLLDSGMCVICDMDEEAQSACDGAMGG